jgi:hypothetical protein
MDDHKEVKFEQKNIAFPVNLNLNKIVLSSYSGLFFLVNDK